MFWLFLLPAGKLSMRDTPTYWTHPSLVGRCSSAAPSSAILCQLSASIAWHSARINRLPGPNHPPPEGGRSEVGGGEKDREVERLGVNEPSATAAVSRDSSWKIRGGHDGTYQGSVIILSGLFQFVSTSRQLEAFLPESSCARCVGNRRLRLRPLHHFIWLISDSFFCWLFLFLFFYYFRVGLGWVDAAGVTRRAAVSISVLSFDLIWFLFYRQRNEGRGKGEVGVGGAISGWDWEPEVTCETPWWCCSIRDGNRKKKLDEKQKQKCVSGDRKKTFLAFLLSLSLSLSLSLRFYVHWTDTVAWAITWLSSKGWTVIPVDYFIHTDTQTDTQTDTYIYLYICVCVCVFNKAIEYETCGY